MATVELVTITDDLDGKSEADETVSFSLDGSELEIDLTEAHARDMRDKLGKWAALARPVKLQRVRVIGQPGRRTAADRERSHEIRTWARANGFPNLPDRGRIPQEVEARYAARNLPAADSAPHVPPVVLKAPTPERRQERQNGNGHRNVPDDLSEAERRVLDTIRQTGKPGNNILAGKLRKRGLVEKGDDGWHVT